MSSLKLSTLTTPACRKAASYTRSSPARDPVWEAMATRLSGARPGFRTTIGLRAAASLAFLRNSWPSRITSRCMAMTFVSGSSAR